MFDVGASELLVIVIVAIVVIGPKDLPLALRTAGRWIGKVRRVSASFRSGLDAMIREAEMEDMEKKWREQNARIMAEHPGSEMTSLDAGTDAEAISDSQPLPDSQTSDSSEPEEPSLPLDKPQAG